MMKTWSIVLGIGLSILWLAGLGDPNASVWMTWLNAVAAVLSFVIATGVSDYSERNIRVGSSIGMAAGLFLLWIGGMSTGVISYQNWWTFIFACGYLVLGIATGSRGPTSSDQTQSEQIQDRYRYRKSA